ncbi:MAG: hypothetical protein JOZ00_14450 [Mycobacterium sp.]|uniref:hypothetical protein n=1 Tax=Mycobacterium sp. TaxID=1785 RepID=UPI001EBB9879|nr:hypothetical protein [Mycobacterium sp.]MBV8787874.1 hypothetical protein [Mycobacterium sp.]
MRRDGQWLLSLYTVLADKPDHAEEELCRYLPSSLEEAKEVAQRLAGEQPWVAAPRAVTLATGQSLYPDRSFATRPTDIEQTPAT